MHAWLYSGSGSTEYVKELGEKLNWGNRVQFSRQVQIYYNKMQENKMVASLYYYFWELNWRAFITFPDLVHACSFEYNEETNFNSIVFPCIIPPSVQLQLNHFVPRLSLQFINSCPFLLSRSIYNIYIYIYN